MKDLSSVAEKTEEVLSSPQQSSSSVVLRSELDLTQKKMQHVYSLSSVYMEKYAAAWVTHLTRREGTA